MVAPSDARMNPIRDSLVGRALVGAGGTHYHLRDVLGEGGQGWVFRAAWGDPSGQVVVVKVLRPDVVTADALSRFQREAIVLRMLSTQGAPNPYVVRFYDHAVASVPSPFGVEPLSLPFTVLEYVHGSTLERELRESRGLGLPTNRVLSLARHIGHALAGVHQHQVVHRDLKPSNILLTSEGGQETAKVTDFGLVKLVDPNLTRTASLAGASLGYAPPEQYEQGNRRVSARTDVFSFAAVVYEMLSGRPAFPYREGENPLLILTRILSGPRPTLSRETNTLPTELIANPPLVHALDRVLGRALAPDPEHRHESVRAFVDELVVPLAAAAEARARSRGGGVSPFEATARATSEPPSRRSTPPVRISSPDGSSAVVATEVDAPVDDAVAAKPESWRFRTLVASIGAGALRHAAFSPDGRELVAVGDGGIARLRDGAWVGREAEALGDARRVVGAVFRPDQNVVLFGARGLAGVLDARGQLDAWSVPDPEVTFLGGFVDREGRTILVGERPYRAQAPRHFPGTTAGVLAQFEGDTLALLAEASSTTRLLAATRTSAGQLLACGEWGILVRLELGVIDTLGSICGGHLRAIAATSDGGALTVGAGGHALSILPTLAWNLEAVQTTRDLHALHVTPHGTAWAASSQARVLRRCAGNWIRVSGDLGITSDLVAVWGSERRVLAVATCGAVVEGTLA